MVFLFIGVFLYIDITISKWLVRSWFSFKQKLFFFQKQRENLSHNKTILLHSTLCTCFIWAGVLSAGSSCHGRIYLEGKHSLRRLQSDCHPAFWCFKYLLLWSEGHFIISLHEKKIKIYCSLVFEWCQKYFWENHSQFLLQMWSYFIIYALDLVTKLTFEYFSQSVPPKHPVVSKYKLRHDSKKC